MTDSIAKDLILRAQQGNPEATGALYSRFHQSIYRYLYYRTGDPQIAEDLTSEVFLKMVQSISAYRVEGTPFAAWLFQVARNQAIDYYRRRNNHPIVAIDEDLEGKETDMDSTVDFHLTTADLAKALSKLEHTQRDVILLRFIEGMSIAQASQILHKSEDAIKALQRRGLIALRVLLCHLENTHA